MHDDEPEFFIIAGPNGAGKSTNGSEFVPKSLGIFNGDRIFADLQLRYPNIRPEQLQGGVAHALEEARDKALASKLSFAFETNYSTLMASEILQQFRQAGYKTTLIYFGLDSLELAASRVQERVALGGHDVPAEVLKYNYDEGIKRINQDLHFFDRVIFVDTLNQNVRVIAFLQKAAKQQVQISEKIYWYNKYFKSTVNKLALMHKQEKGIKPRYRLH